MKDPLSRRAHHESSLGNRDEQVILKSSRRLDIL